MTLQPTENINMPLSKNSHPDESFILKKMPARLSLLSKAIVARGVDLTLLLNESKSKKSLIPKLSLNITSVKSEAKKIKHYAEVCHFKFDGKTLPMTYPHILAFDLHLKLMINKRFPLPIMGLVHLRNTITAHRNILIDELLDFHVFIGESHTTNKGIEFNIHSQVSIQGETVWESVSTTLYIFKDDAKKALRYRKASPRHQKYKSPLRYHQHWPLPENLGRSYAFASGDANPIHLHTILAKAFGFKHAIIHGMWLKARTIAALSPIINDQSVVNVSVEFKQPTPLNSEVRMNYQEKDSQTNASLDNSNLDGGIDFEIRSQDGRKLHMVGSITYPKII